MKKQKVSDYIVNELHKHGIRQAFMVPGGFSMHLIDSFSKKNGISCCFNHHEQACAMAAEAYARINNEPAVVCTTVGPGATNAITGVLCAYQDSIPMLVISGQVRLATMARKSGLALRSRGIQEFDIIPAASSFTKYAVLVENCHDVRYCLEKALYLAKHGRPGPCWIDIPMDIQGQMVEPETLKAFVPSQEGYIDFPAKEQDIQNIIEHIEKAKRPVIFAGNGIRLAGAHKEFLRFVDKVQIPVVDGMSSVDAIPTDHPLYAGRSGTTGTRSGNFVIQNSDLLLSLGSRLNYNQTGFNTASWARKAFKIINDIDKDEISKDSINADISLHCDVLDLLKKLNSYLDKRPLSGQQAWIESCQEWQKKYPVVTDAARKSKLVHLYNFYDILTERLPSDVNIVVSVGASRVVGSQAAHIKKGQRFITNATTASMGYCLPAAIGACLGNGSHKTVLVTGEGSLQMNIQELQTIIHHMLPIAIFVINNQGYHTIKQTQKNFCNGNYAGIGPESGDLSFPDMKKIAAAYGFEFLRIELTVDLNAKIDTAIATSKPVICEVVVDATQVTAPKVSSRRIETGEMVSMPLEDMAPFLSRDELKGNMYIPLYDEK